MLTLKDKILLFFDLLSDEPLFNPRRAVYSTFSSYSPSSVDQRLRSLARKGLLKIDGRGPEGTVVISDSLRKSFEEGDFGISRLRSSQKPWDGLWRLVVFDIAEENRSLRGLLRKKLKSLGFAMFQKSIWVTPFDVTHEIAKFLDETKIKGPVEVLEAKRLFAGDEGLWARGAWHLDEINQNYRDLLVKKDLTFDDYLKVKTEDSLLPMELRPSPWFEDDLIKVLRNKIVEI